MTAGQSGGPEERRCPRCGATSPPGQPEGRPCPRCLLSLGLSQGLASTASDLSLVPPKEGAPDLPERVGPFRILEVLGGGPGSVVYLAEEERPVRRRVALRVVDPGLDEKEVLARFESERSALESSRHRGIAPVLDAGTSEDGRLYFVAEWVPGVPITEYCDRKRLTVSQRLELFAELCDAVETAHAHELLHRDLKPSNVLVTEEDGAPRARVIDFGIARALDQKLTDDALYTARGILVATPAYTSPEQSAGRDVDARSDTYSMGVLLHELLVGAPPFEAGQLRRAGWAEMLRVIQQDVPPRPSARVAASADVALARRTEPRRLARELRGDLDWIVLKALQKDPSRRYQSASELRGDIRRVLEGEPVAPGLRSAVRRLLRVLRR